MADQPTVVHVSENSPEKIAWNLFQEVKFIEKADTAPDRKWLLDTFAECLEAARGRRSFTRDS